MLATLRDQLRLATATRDPAVIHSLLERADRVGLDPCDAAVAEARMALFRPAPA